MLPWLHSDVLVLRSNSWAAGVMCVRLKPWTCQHSILGCTLQFNHSRRTVVYMHVCCQAASMLKQAVYVSSCCPEGKAL